MPTSEQSVQEEKQAGSEEEALQAIIKQFENCTQEQLKELAKKASQLEKIWQEKKAFADKAGLDKLRHLLDQILNKEKEECEKNKKVRTFTTESCDAVHQALCHLTRHWPSNDPASASEEKNTPSFECPICYEDISEEKNRIVTSFPYQFHTHCLVHALSIRPEINPMNNLSFSARDCKLIKEKAVQNGFTVYERPTGRPRYKLAAALMIVGGILLVVGSILSALGIALTLATIFYLTGLASSLGGAFYGVYLDASRASQALVNAEERENRYRAELAEAIARSLQEQLVPSSENRARIPSPKSVEEKEDPVNFRVPAEDSLLHEQSSLFGSNIHNRQRSQSAQMDDSETFIHNRQRSQSAQMDDSETILPANPRLTEPPQARIK